MSPIPFEIPTLDKLGLPSDVRRLCTLPRGLILVTGPTGSGKSTTLAAMLNYMNTNFEYNMVTIEELKETFAAVFGEELNIADINEIKPLLS